MILNMSLAKKEKSKMPMPKGHRKENGYSTVQTHGGMGYREIAEEMTKSGDKMNHSTARNVFLKAVKKVARDTCVTAGVSFSEKDLEKIASDPRFQSGLVEIISDESYKVSV